MLYNRKLENNNSWKGGRIISQEGYVKIMTPDHPRKDSEGYVFEHILIIEKAMGKYLNKPAETHHVDGDKSNNQNNNLVACNNLQYHHLLHYRTKAYLATGDANRVHCYVCGEWKEKEAFGRSSERVNGRKKICKACRSRLWMERKPKRP